MCKQGSYLMLLQIKASQLKNLLKKDTISFLAFYCSRKNHFQRGIESLEFLREFEENLLHAKIDEQDLPKAKENTKTFSL